MIYDMLFDYQKKTVNALKEYDSCGLFYDVGCGKTITSLALYEDKLIRRLVDKLIVVCLYSKIEEWQKDIEHFFPFSKVLIFDGKDKTLRDFRKGDWDICIINFEKTWRNKDLYLISNRTMIIIDESHKIHDSETKIGKFMKGSETCTPYKIILTATPMSKGYIDIYNQFYFLGLLDMRLNEFKKKYCIEQLVFFPGMKPFKKITGYRNTQDLDLLIQRYTRYHKREIADNMLPEEIVIPIKIDSKYRKIMKDRVYEDIVLDKVSRKRLADKSLCSGTIMGKTLVSENGEPLNRVYQLNKYKINWIKDFLESFQERVVIYYLYDHQCEQLYNMIRDLDRPCARYNSTYKEQATFENNDNAVLLVQYKSGSTGLDWLKSAYVEIFYTLPDSYIEFYQAKGRINRIGQTHKPLYYILLAGDEKSADNLNYQALLNQEDFTDDFYDRNFN